MAVEDVFRKVEEGFQLHDEILVVVTDADGEDEPVAVAFWRQLPGAAHVEEREPDAVEDTLTFAKNKAAELGRPVVVQLDSEDVWWPHWGTLA